MNRDILKTLVITFIVLFSVFFIGIDGVEAGDCYCYYASTGKSTANVSAATARGVGEINLSEFENVYVLKYRFTSNNIAVIKGSCVAENYAAKLSKGCSDLGSQKMENDGVYDTLLENKIPKSIADKNCSVDACNLAGFTVSKRDGKFYLSVGGSGDKVWATDENEYERLLNAKNSGRTANNDGVSDQRVDALYGLDSIIFWGQHTSNHSKNKYTKCDIIDEDTLTFLKSLFLIIQVIGIILLIFLTMVEAVKTLTGSMEHGFKTFIKNTLIRILGVILLLILPMLVIWVLNIVNSNAYVKDKNGKIMIGEQGDPLCSVDVK